jgi:hypothetical protein
MEGAACLDTRESQAAQTSPLHALWRESDVERVNAFARFGLTIHAKKLTNRAKGQCSGDSVAEWNIL